MVRATTEAQEAADRMSHYLDKARLVGYNEMGHICIWTGGYSFNVYDAATDWDEVTHFTTGTMVDENNIEKARERMKMEGFDPV